MRGGPRGASLSRWNSPHQRPARSVSWSHCGGRAERRRPANAERIGTIGESGWRSGTSTMRLRHRCELRVRGQTVCARRTSVSRIGLIRLELQRPCGQRACRRCRTPPAPAGPESCGAPRAERQRRRLVQHAAGHGQPRWRPQSAQILVGGQGRAPVDHDRPCRHRCQDQGLASARRYARSSFDRPRVRPAMKCRCIRKNISDRRHGRQNAPADTRCHGATHWPLRQ